MHARDKNLRILVLDDNQAIHEDFRKILQPGTVTQVLDEARASLFGVSISLPSHDPFEVDGVDQGQAELCEGAQRAGPRDKSFRATGAPSQTSDATVWIADCSIISLRRATNQRAQTDNAAVHACITTRLHGSHDSS